MALRLVICAVVLTVVGWAQFKDEIWITIPKAEKTEILVREPYLMGIQALLFTCENWRRLRQNPTADCGPVQTVLEVAKRPALLLAIVNYGDKSIWFSPLNFAFTQGKRQWNVKWQDVVPIDPLFGGGLIRPLVIISGLLLLPEGLDLTQPFRLWYGDYWGIIGAK